MQAFIFALTFLTRIPLPVKVEYDEHLPSVSAAYYPLVGVIIGLILVLVDKVALLVFPVRVSNVLILIVLIFLTGGLHLDGFMDSIDGLFSGRERERIFKIMHDSRTGAFGVIALFLLLFLKYTLLLELGGISRVAGLILMPAVSRWMIVFAAYKFPVAGSSEIARNFFKYLNRKELYTGLLSLIFSVLILTYFTGFHNYQGIIVFILPLLLTAIMAKVVVGKIGGLTGDIYGAFNEINEVFILMVLLILQTIV